LPIWVTTFVIFGQLAQVSRLIHRLGKGLLAVNVFAELNPCRSHHRVKMVGNGDGNGIDILFLFIQHIAPILIKLGVRMSFARFLSLLFVGVADGNDFLAAAVLDVAAAFATGADATDPEFFTTAGHARLGFADGWKCCPRLPKQVPSNTGTGVD
jgi:hypothetical protein